MAKSAKRSGKKVSRGVKRTAPKKVKRAAKKQTASKTATARRRWKVYCQTDGLVGTYTNYQDARRAKSTHTPGHSVTIIGEQ